MTDTMAPLLALLSGSILPRLEEIQASQIEQRLQTDRLERAVAELRSTLSLHFAEIRTELAACQARMEDILVTLREAEASNSPGSPAISNLTKKTLPN
jgi:ABC-type phosphate transport system auxiliary subunit